MSVYICTVPPRILTFLVSASLCYIFHTAGGNAQRGTYTFLRQNMERGWEVSAGIRTSSSGCFMLNDVTDLHFFLLHKPRGGNRPGILTNNNMTSSQSSHSASSQ
ncbi:hypothetical protein F5X99DRAFT_151031 [Biscogniauxia marginata]|nr:hypothetical protein F5X99DRAFT_151031 [Biscogniauxia marginata]